jgi:hypothetical protein
MGGAGVLHRAPRWLRAVVAQGVRDRGGSRPRQPRLSDGAELVTPVRDKDAPVIQQQTDISGQLAIYEDRHTACLRRMGWQD